VATLPLGILVYFPYDAGGQNRYPRLTGPLVQSMTRNWTPENDIPEFCKKALVASEDDRFFSHNGIDVEELKKLTHQELSGKKNKRGGSTITQQLVKNAFLSRNRSYIRKAREIVGAVILDRILSKQSQLTWYWNIVEFGPKIYGIEGAAQHYFKKNPAQLTATECASLVAILPSPNKWNVSLETKTPTAFFLERRSVILQRAHLWSLEKSLPPMDPALLPQDPDDSQSEENGTTVQDEPDQDTPPDPSGVEKEASP